MTTKEIQSYEQSLQQTVDKFGSLLALDTKQQELIKLHKMIDLGFDPRLGHMCVYEQKIWLCHVGAMWWKNMQDPDRRFGIIHRIIPKTDKESYGLSNDDLGVIAQIVDYRNGGVVIVEGFGKANPQKPYRNNPIELNNPFIMAQKRAEAQAIKRGFPLGIELETMADEDKEYIDSTARVVDEKTGEIKEPIKPLHPWLEACPVHGDGWTVGKYGRFHKYGNNLNCTVKKALENKVKELWSLVGEGSCNDWIKSEHAGKTWSQISDEEAIEVIEELQERSKNDESETNESEQLPY